MLGFPLLYFKGMRLLMFQLAGFYMYYSSSGGVWLHMSTVRAGTSVSVWRGPASHHNSGFWDILGEDTAQRSQYPLIKECT